MNEPYRLRYTNQIVGVFLLVVLLFVILLAVLLLRAGDFFADQQTYWFEISQEEVRDLHPGIEVMILGKRAGQIDDIRYVADSDRVRIEIAIDAAYTDQVFANSIIVPDRKYGVGAPILNLRRPPANRDEIDPPSPKPLADGNRIAAFRSEDDRIEQMAREVKTVADSVALIQQQLTPMLTSVSETSDNIDTSMSETINPAFTIATEASASFIQTNEVLRPKADETLQVIREATLALREQIGDLTAQVQALVTNDLKKTLAEVRESTDDVSATAKKVDDVSEEASQSITATLQTLNKAAEQVRLLAEESRQVVRVVQSEANELPGTTARVNDTVSETQDLVGEIQNSWLLRNSNSRRSSGSSQVSPSSVRGGIAR